MISGAVRLGNIDRVGRRLVGLDLDVPVYLDHLVSRKEGLGVVLRSYRIANVKSARVRLG